MWIRFCTRALPLVLREYVAVITVTVEGPGCVLARVGTVPTILLTLIYVCKIQVVVKDKVKLDGARIPCPFGSIVVLIRFLTTQTQM